MMENAWRGRVVANRAEIDELERFPIVPFPISSAVREK